MHTVARVVRTIGLVAATVAAVAVFVVGGRDGGADWQVPGLVLIGVLVVILQASTSMSRRPAPLAASPMVSAPSPSPGALPGHVSYVPGLPQVQIPKGSFPDPGHSHGPIIQISDDRPPPPLHEVLRPDVDGPAQA